MLELKNVTLNLKFSEETLQYRAKVYFDGQNVE